MCVFFSYRKVKTRMKSWIAGGNLFAEQSLVENEDNEKIRVNCQLITKIIVAM